MESVSAYGKTEFIKEEQRYRAVSLFCMYGKLLLEFACLDAIHQSMDTSDRIEQIGGGSVAVEGVNDIRDILAHIDLAVPFTGEKLGCTVDQVGGVDAVKQTFLVAGVELFKTCGEQTEGGEDEDLGSILFLELVADIENGVAGCDHIVNDDDVLTFNGVAEVFVCNDRVTTVDNGGIVTSLIEHTEVETQDGGVVHAAGQTAFVGRNDHRVAVEQIDFGFLLDECLDHLIRGTDTVKAGQRNSILNACVVSVKGDDVGNAHGDQFLQAHCTVEGFACGALVLSAFIEHRHDNGNSSCLTADSTDDTLQISEMIIGGHGNLLTVHGVGFAVVEAVGDDINVMSAHGIVKHTLCFAGTESGAVCRDDEVFCVLAFAELMQILIDAINKAVAASHTDDTELAIVLRIHYCTSKNDIFVDLFVPTHTDTFYNNIVLNYDEKVNGEKNEKWWEKQHLFMIKE